MKIRNILMLAAVALSSAACCNQKCDKCAEETSACVDKGAVVIENIMTRRSVRKYTAQPVSRDTLMTIAKCGINAPNGMNRQPWEVRILDNKATIDSLTAIFKAKEPRFAQDSTMVNMFRNAPAVIFVAAVDGAQLDCGILGENMALAAWGMGLGSCFLGGPIAFIKNTPEMQPFLASLSLSENAELVYALGVGYPDETPEAKPRDEGKIKFVE